MSEKSNTQLVFCANCTHYESRRFTGLHRCKAVQVRRSFDCPAAVDNEYCSLVNHSGRCVLYEEAPKRRLTWWRRVYDGIFS